MLTDPPLASALATPPVPALASLLPPPPVRMTSRRRSSSSCDTPRLTSHPPDSPGPYRVTGLLRDLVFARAPRLNPNRTLITGMICGYRVEEIEEPLMRELRYMDKLIDELAKGRKMEKILRAG